MYKQVDWLMGEAGRIDEILSLKSVVGANTRLITCMSDFGGGDPTETVPEGIKAGVGLYGYAKPSNNGGTIDLDKIFPRQLSQLVGNSKRIAVLARAYRGMSVDSVWQDGTFVEPENPLPFRLAFKGRRGFSDTGMIDVQGHQAIIYINMPYRSGRAMLTRVAEKWPDKILVHLRRTHADRPAPREFRVANGMIGVSIVQGESIEVLAGEMEGSLALTKTWGKSFLNEGAPDAPIKLDAVEATTTDKFVEVLIPTVITEGNPQVICFEWGTDGQVR
jgi:hypothetical protein